MKNYFFKWANKYYAFHDGNQATIIELDGRDRSTSVTTRIAGYKERNRLEAYTSVGMAETVTGAEFHTARINAIDKLLKTCQPCHSPV